ncbi:PhoH family protein [bacterium]|nr:PhoH family protein [Candidatus Omnitrophota bacterium]MBU3929354.1 PhoH family protein [bacterium]MBU4122469.1 PhoH family protein [bacterium]
MFDVGVSVRANSIVLRGKARDLDEAAKEIENLRRGGVLTDKRTGADIVPSAQPPLTFRGGRKISPSSPAQKKYMESMLKNPVTIATGPAGTGKTFLAVLCALSFLEEGRFSKIILSRPIVEAGERLGYLPGDFEEKVSPYLAPLNSAFITLAGERYYGRQKAAGVIEIVPLAYMRGRTLDDAFVILDEAQNTTALQMKMILTRLGPKGAICINGDETQIDLERGVKSGLVNAHEVLAGIRGIKFIKFSKRDVVRHPLVKKIVAAYGAVKK